MAAALPRRWFVRAEALPGGLRWFAGRQPCLPIVETSRGPLTGTAIGDLTRTAIGDLTGTAIGDSGLVAVLCCVGTALAGHLRVRAVYHRASVR